MMPIKHPIYIGALLIMLSPLLKAFGMSKVPTEITLGAMRHVNISGNVLSFAMPENFSGDMPAEPLIETLKLDTLTKESSGLLLQRWWDIKEPGFFGKALGTIMMTMNVYKVPENTRKLFRDSAYDITDRTDLVFIIDESVHLRYNDVDDTGNEFDHGLPEIFMLLGTNLSTEFRDHVHENQKWTGYSIGGANNQLIVNSVLPIDEKHFIELSFNYSPNNGVLPRYFRDLAYKITSPIEESLRMEYTAANALKEVVEKKWINITVKESLSLQTEALVKKLFHPESYEQYRIGIEQESKGAGETQ